MTGPMISLSYSFHITCKHMCSPCLSSSLLPFTLPLSTPPPIDLPPPPPPPLPTHTTEAVVLFDYVEKHDDELSLEMGDVITNVEQVCEPQFLLLKTTVH